MCIYSSVYLVQYGLTSSLLPGSGFWCFQSHRYTSNMFYFVLWSELQVAGTIPCCSWDIGIWQWLCAKPGALGDKSKQHVCSMHHFLRINYGKLLRFFDLVKAPYQNLNRIDEAPWVQVAGNKHVVLRRLFTPLRVGWPPTPQVYFGPWEGAKGGFPPWGLLRIFTSPPPPPVGAPQAREFSLFSPVAAPQAREFSLFPPRGGSPS